MQVVQRIVHDFCHSTPTPPPKLTSSALPSELQSSPATERKIYLASQFMIYKHRIKLKDWLLLYTMHLNNDSILAVRAAVELEMMVQCNLM